MNPASAKNRSGIALIIVMISIATLSFLTAAFAYMMKVETKLAQNANSEVELLWLGRSGVEYARYILAMQTTIVNEPYDALNQVWAGGPGNGTNAMADITLKNYHLGDGTFSLTIVDLERKVNINIVDDIVLEQAFHVMGIDAGDSPLIAGSILDWIDADDDQRLNGAESTYYQGLTPPYDSKNAAIADLSELLLIRGITPDMYWGSASTNHPPAFFQGDHGRAVFRDQAPEYACGLVDMFTPISTGRVNINTASALVLQMIPSVDENVALAIIAQRAGPDGVDGTEDDTPFQNVGELVNVGIGGNQQAMNNLRRLCDVRSHTFEVTVDAEIAGYKRQFVAIVGRNSAIDVPVLNFSWR